MRIGSLLYLLLFLLLPASVMKAQPHSGFYFMFLNSNPEAPKLNNEEVSELMKGHLGNIDRMVEMGVLKVAGPFDAGGGVFIFETSSEDSIHAWLKPDPGIQSNRWNLELFPAQIVRGRICPGQDYGEMRSFGFIRAEAPEGASGKDFAKFRKRLKKWVAKKDVPLLSAIELEGSGFVLVFDDWDAVEAEREYRNSGIPSQTGFEFQTKTWWAAEHVLCP